MNDHIEDDNWNDDFDDWLDILHEDQPIGKIRKRTDKTCPECGEGFLYIITYEQDKNGILYSQEYYECLECRYKYEKKNKNHHKESSDVWSES